MIKTNRPDLSSESGAKRLSPLDMNKLAILKDHTVITFTDTEKA